MAASCSLLLVNYKTAMLAAEAIRTARLASRSPLQIVVVDNSVDPHQADVLRRYADIVIAPEENLGYAAAMGYSLGIISVALTLIQLRVFRRWSEV